MSAAFDEFGVTPGAETTSGPLGQGIACAVGMAVAEKVMAAQFNREGHTIMDHHTYVFMGDGLNQSPYRPQDLFYDDHGQEKCQDKIRQNRKHGDRSEL